ncbi:glycosyltransferase family 4 protein [Natronococcus amylolyticus]|uniref:glycosyltransferase family 4 protein n=1 Tax=Natronococcus amylolyticus TaxID=44470 RepID=UPI000A07484C|nr:glycosyltransferase family 4 protein [Natronococcus amylolyticus]
MTKGKLLIRDKIAPFDTQLRGGSGNYVYNLSTELASRGWQVDMLSPSSLNYEAPKTEGVNYEFFDYSNPTTIYGRFKHTFQGWRKVSEITKSNHYDLVIDNISHLPHLPLQYYTKENNSALIVHNLKMKSAIKTSGILKASTIVGVEKLLPYLNPDQIICAGPSTEARVQNKLDFDSTAVLRPCINTNSIGYNYDPKSKKVLFLGRITDIKNVGLLLDAWKILAEKFPEFELIIAGDGPKRKELERRTKEEKISRVTFTGFVEGKEKKNLLEESLAMVIPSMFEGYVTTGLEAMAAGTIVVGSDRRGINDYVIDSENGYLFPYDDLHSFEEILSAILSNPTEHQSIAEAGYKTSKRHSAERFGDRADEIVDTLVNTPPTYQ